MCDERSPRRTGSQKEPRPDGASLQQGRVSIQGRISTSRGGSSSSKRLSSSWWLTATTSRPLARANSARAGLPGRKRRSTSRAEDFEVRHFAGSKKKTPAPTRRLREKVHCNDADSDEKEIEELWSSRYHD
ncbi:unnamed protein product [Prorocentrum cordatum]|uniref:Uncharacterized protein n=1 Tax=Prorocentrum cordatum TaxID=2364126 RepID=A0ABN9PD25_9DINO|nr:unnamed protein product [Polarella glacialis]